MSAAKHILFKSEFLGDRMIARLLPNQSIFTQMDRRPEDIKVTIDVPQMGRLGIDTVLVSSDFTIPEEGHLHINKFTGLFREDTIHPVLTGMSEELTDQLNYMVDYMLENSEWGVDKAKHLVSQFGAYGFEVDWEELTKPKPLPEVGSATGLNIKRMVATTYPCPRQEDCGFHIDGDTWNLLVRNVLRGVSTMLVGPTGSGKTEIMKYLATAMSRKLFIQDMGTVQDAQSALIGVHRLDASGKSVFDPAPWVGYIQSGELVLADEINRAPLSAANILFPQLDDRRYLPLDLAAEGEERHIPVHEKTVFFATANLGSEYSGTQAVDRALLDRFFIIELDYMSPENEIKVLTKRTGIDTKPAEAIVKVAEQIRKAHREQELSSAVSTRHTLQAASLVADGFDLGKALDATIMPLFEDAIGVSERSKVKTICAAF